MTPPARRDGTPDKPEKDDTFYISYAKPAKKQHVRLDKRRKNAVENEPHPLDDNWWDDNPGEKARKTEGIRLQKVLAAAGVGSRRACELLIAEGRVEVDGQVVTELGVRVDPLRQTVHVDGERIQLDESRVYLAFNKPAGVVTTMSDELGRLNIGDYVAGRPERLFHVGRLDADTEGLLILTNDGDLAHRLMHPSYEVPKTYLVQVRGPMEKGTTYMVRPCIEPR